MGDYVCLAQALYRRHLYNYPVILLFDHVTRRWYGCLLHVE
jgi:hypothetical protein